jgi:hypothetical protein
MRASPFSLALLNLCGLLPELSLYYSTKEEAYQWLKDNTGQDFGYNGLAWEEWGRTHDKFHSGWTGIASHLETLKK